MDATHEAPVALELDDIQGGVLRPRPSPYVATYLLLRVAHREAGRKLMGQLSTAITSAASPHSPRGDTWVSVALTYAGLKALGVPQESLDSFAWEFQQGMRARAKALGDVGESSPEHWDPPFRNPQDIHVVLVAIAPDAEQLEAAFAKAQQYVEAEEGVEILWRQDCRQPPDGREPFGYRDGISHPAVEGSGTDGTNPNEAPLKAGEFVLGYPDELGGLPPMPSPDVLGRNGTYVVFRKLHQQVAAFRQYLKTNSKSPEDGELVAAKLMGRWRSGAPLARCPVHDDPELGADIGRSNDFGYGRDAIGYDTPPGSHIRRSNPRDAAVAGVVRLHRMIRRGTAYGPLLPEGVMEDDGADRGLMFAFIGAHLGRQFEFVQTEWLNHGDFAGLGQTKDAIAGANEPGESVSLPRKPIPRKLQGLSRFVITRGGEYCFMPGLRAMRWLAELP